MKEKEKKKTNFQKKITGDAQGRQNIKGAANSRGVKRHKVSHLTDDKQIEPHGA